MSIRQYDFVTGIESASAPGAGTPTLSSDFTTLSYQQGHFVQGAQPVADITALKAVAAANRADNDLRFVDAKGLVYQFDSASSATGDDNFVVTPTAGTGRWIAVGKFPNIEVQTNKGQAGTPANPASGFYKVYVKSSDGQAYILDSAGTETALAGAGVGTATPTVSGKTSSYFPLIQSAVLTSASATINITTTDGYHTVICSHTSSQTVNLPAAASNNGRMLVVKKSAAGGFVTIDANASETIDGTLTFVLYSQYDRVSLACDGANWNVVDSNVTIVARFKRTTAQSVNSATDTIIDYATSVVDTASAVTTGASWKFTAPKTGYYHIAASIGYGGVTGTANSRYLISLYLNGSIYATTHTPFEVAAVDEYRSLNINTVMNLSATNYIDFRVYQNSGSAKNFGAGGGDNGYVSVILLR